MWGQGTRALPWGKPYLQDIKSTLLQNDPGYQQAKAWWESNQRDFEATKAERDNLLQQLHAENAKYSQLVQKYGRALTDLERTRALRSVPRDQSSSDPPAQPHFASAAEGTSGAARQPALSDARGSARVDEAPRRPAECADTDGRAAEGGSDE